MMSWLMAAIHSERQKLWGQKQQKEKCSYLGTAEQFLGRSGQQGARKEAQGDG